MYNVLKTGLSYSSYYHITERANMGQFKIIK